MTFVVAQISDTHLGGPTAPFAPAFDKLAAWFAKNPADLIVHSGDVTLDGVKSARDLDDAAALLGKLDAPLRCIAGNHDVGESTYPGVRETAVTRTALDGWSHRFGPHCWIEDIPGWRLLGIDAQVLGSGLDEESMQYEFVREAVASSETRRIGLFCHKPLFDRSPDEVLVSGRFVNPDPRAKLYDALSGSTLGFVGSGHVHQFRTLQVSGTTHVWAPSASFTFPDRMQPLIGEKIVGYVEHRLAPDGRHSATLKRVPGLSTDDLDRFPDAYNHR